MSPAPTTTCPACAPQQCRRRAARGPTSRHPGATPIARFPAPAPSRDCHTTAPTKRSTRALRPDCTLPRDPPSSARPRDRAEARGGHFAWSVPPSAPTFLHSGGWMPEHLPFFPHVVGEGDHERTDG